MSRKETKYTKEEIVTALQQCQKGTCRGCPAYMGVEHSRCREIYRGAVELIRQGCEK